MSENPYAAPVAEIPPLHTGGISEEQALEIRRAHIKHESSVRTVGILYYIGSAAFLVMGIIGAWNAIKFWNGIDLLGSGNDHGSLAAAKGELYKIFIAVCVTLGLALLQLISGKRVRQLSPSGRYIGIVLSTLGLLAFPAGTLINAYILYLLISVKSAMLFSATYKEIIALSPGVTYKTPKAFWIIMGIFALLLILGWLSPSLS